MKIVIFTIAKNPLTIIVVNLHLGLHFSQPLLLEGRQLGLGQVVVLARHILQVLQQWMCKAKGVIQGVSKIFSDSKVKN